MIYILEHSRYESVELTCADMVRLAALWGLPLTLCARPVGGTSRNILKKQQ